MSALVIVEQGGAGSRFEVRGSRFEVRGSRFEVQGSRFKVRGSRFKVGVSGIWSPLRKALKNRMPRI